MEKIKVFVADDALASRILLKNIVLSSDNFEIVGESDSALSTIILCEDTNPDVLLLEASISGTEDIGSIIKELKNTIPKIKIILCMDVYSIKNPTITYDIGFEDFLVKPFVKEKVLGLLNQVSQKL